MKVQSSSIAAKTDYSMGPYWGVVNPFPKWNINAILLKDCETFYLVARRLLTALHLADRLRALENELIALKERVDHKSREFALLLDKAIE